MSLEKIFLFKETDQSKRDESNDLWKNSLVLIKSKVGQQHSHWPIPEAYWPDSIKYSFIFPFSSRKKFFSRTSLPPRNAHPIVVFRCERVEPLFNTDFPLDKYELDSASPLAQFILDVKESNLCWQVLKKFQSLKIKIHKFLSAKVVRIFYKLLDTGVYTLLTPFLEYFL